METQIIHVALRVIVVASIVHVFLPSYETFDGFPRFQKYYKLFVAIVAWIALNARGQMMKLYGVDTGKASQGQNDETKP